MLFPEIGVTNQHPIELKSLGAVLRFEPSNRIVNIEYSDDAQLYDRDHQIKKLRKAMKETEDGQRIAHSVLLVALTSRFMTKLPFHHDVVALYGLDNIRFINPVFIDDTVQLGAEIVEKEVTDEERGLITFDCELRKHGGTTGMTLNWLTVVGRM